MRGRSPLDAGGRRRQNQRGSILVQALAGLALLGLMGAYLLPSAAALLRGSEETSAATRDALLLESAAHAVMAQAYSPAGLYSLSAVPLPPGYTLTPEVLFYNPLAAPAFGTGPDYPDGGLQWLRLVLTRPDGQTRTLEFYRTR